MLSPLCQDLHYSAALAVRLLMCLALALPGEPSAALVKEHSTVLRRSEIIRAKVFALAGPSSVNTLLFSRPLPLAPELSSTFAE